MRSRSLSRRAAARLLCTLVLAGAAGAQTVQLSPPFDLDDIVGEVLDFRLHPAGSHVLFRVDARRQDVYELYRAPLDGSEVPRPVVALGVGWGVVNYEFTPSGQHLVHVVRRPDNGHSLRGHRVGVPGTYLLDPAIHSAEIDFAFHPEGEAVVYLAGSAFGRDLYRVPVDGSALPLRISRPLGAGESVTHFLPAPGGRVLYLVGTQLHSVGLDGSAPASLDVEVVGPDPFPVQATLPPLALAGDGSVVVYRRRTSAGTPVVHELFAAPIDGSEPPARLNAPLVPGGTVRGFTVTPDGSHVVYAADAEVAGRHELHRVSIAGGTPSVVSGPAMPTQRIDIVRAVGDRVAYVRASDSQRELHAVTLDGSPPVVLKTWTASSVVGEALPSHDGQWMAYSIGGFFGQFYGRHEQWVVRLDGSAPARRLGNGTPGGFSIRDDSERMLYRTGAALFSVPIDHSTTPVRVATLDAERTFTLSKGGALAVFIADAETQGVHELFAAHGSTGQGRVKLSRELALGTDSEVPYGFEILPGGERVAFRVTEPGSSRVFTASLDGSPEPRVVGGSGIAGFFVASPDGSRIVYVSRPTTSSPRELHSVPADGSAAPTFLATGLDAFKAYVTPDGTRVVAVIDGRFQVIPIAGGSPHVLEPSASAVAQVLFTPDSQSLLFRQSGELRIVPLDGSAAALSLSQPDELVRQVLLSLDGLRAFYRVSVGRIERVDVDGTHPVNLATSVSTGFSDMVLAPDGEWLVYRGAMPEVFAVRTDGSSPPVSLGPGLPVEASAGEAVYHVSPDSTRVVFIAGAGDDAGLYAAPIDGTAPPSRLTPVFSPGQGIVLQRRAFAITPDAMRVVYVANQDETTDFDIYVVPIDASAPAARLGGPLVRGPFGYLGNQFRITADSTAVLYQTDKSSLEAKELFFVPLHGSRDPVKLNRPVSEPGCDGDFQLTPDSRRVVYRATEIPQTFELFATELPRIPKDRHLLRR